MAGRRKRPALHTHQNFSLFTPPSVVQPVRESKKEGGRRSVTDFLDSLFEPVLSDSLEDLTNPSLLQTKLKGRGGMPPPPSPPNPGGQKKLIGAIPLLSPPPRGEREDVKGTVANMAAAFAQRQLSRRITGRDDASSIASEPMSDFARLLAAKKAGLKVKTDEESKWSRGIAVAGRDLQSQLLAKRQAMMGISESNNEFPPSRRRSIVASFHSPSSADDEILLSAPPHPNFPPPPPPGGDHEAMMSSPSLADPFAPSSLYKDGHEKGLADALSDAALSVSGIDRGLLLGRGKPVRLLRTIQGPAVTYNKPSWSVNVRKEVS